MHRYLLATLPLCLALFAQEPPVPAPTAPPPAPKSGILNILDLGAKNDGSEDISDIVNAHTQRAAIHLPAGLYKVSKPLHLKNPLSGEGYSRVPWRSKARTWLVSDIQSKDASVGVINFSKSVSMSVTNLSIACASNECGIRIPECTQGTTTFIDKVGIFGVRSYGIYIKGGGSRPIYLQNVTIFGHGDYPVPGTGIFIGGPVDNRLSNLEIMCVRIGLELHGGYNFGDNIHIWTGCLRQRDKNDWWKGTRSIILDYGAFFSGTNIYPDTSYYALETRKPNCTFDIQNIMYWQDGSTRDSAVRDGEFFHGPGSLKLNGGLIFLATGKDDSISRWQSVYSPNQKVTNVTLRSDFLVKPENLKRLCLTNALPDYSVSYNAKGLCRIADIVAAAPTGSCQATITLADGAAFRLDALRDRTGKLDATITPLNRLCDGHELKLRQRDGVISVFVRSDDANAPWPARVVTNHMGDFFRPIDYSILRNSSGHERFAEVLTSLD